MSTLRAAAGGLYALRWSLIAAVVFAVLSFGLLGMPGYVLYGLVSPVLTLVYPPLTRWDPSIVWPLIVAAGLLWPVSFIPAGYLDLRLKRAGASRLRRRIAYLAVLWAGALASWWLILALNPPATRPL